MPSTRVAAAIDQDQVHPRRSSERKATKRATSVPVSRRENPALESLRSKKQKLSSLDAEDIPPSSLPGSVIARGRKRDLSPRDTSQANLMAGTSASVAEPIADAGEQRPRKRRKRSSSTPAVARSSQLSTQLQSRRRSRSRVGSPTTNVEYVLPSRVSARLAARKIHPFINSRGSDIYTHLADPDGAGNLLSEPSAGSIILSTSNEMVGSQSVRKPRGRRRKTVDLGDENVKKDLMEEWAQLRQSQGALPLSGIDKNACLSQMLCRDTRKGDGSFSSMQLEAMTLRNSPDPDAVESQTTTTINPSQSQETIVDVSSRGPLTRMDFENALPADTDTLGNKLDHKGSVPPPDEEIEQPMVPSVDIEALSASIPNPRVDKGSPDEELDGLLEILYHDVVQRPISSPPRLFASPSREDSVHVRHTLPVNEQAEVAGLNDPSKDSHSVTLSQAHFVDNSTIHLDSNEEFYMLDMPEIFTLPWVPVASQLYVPPGLGKLVSGMREQLTMAARARRRAEELYQTELSRRISAEKIVEDLRRELEEKRKDSSGGATC